MPRKSNESLEQYSKSNFDSFYLPSIFDKLFGPYYMYVTIAILTFCSRPEVIIGILAMALKTITTYPILLFCGREAFTCALEEIKLLCRRRSTRTSPLDELVASSVERTPNDPEQLEEHHELDTNVKQRCVVVLCWYALSLLCAILVPNIGTAISFLGCLAAVFIFTIPGLILMALILHSDSSLVRTDMALLILSGVFNVIGAFIFGVVLTQDVQRIVYS